MSKRPEALSSHLSEQKERTNQIVLNGLSRLEKPESWTDFKVSASGLKLLIKEKYGFNISENSIYNRKFAIDKLKAIKEAKKNYVASDHEKKSVKCEEQNNVSNLRTRLKNALNQNVSYYNEIINLQRQLAKNEDDKAKLKEKLDRANQDKVLPFNRGQQ